MCVICDVFARPFVLFKLCANIVCKLAACTEFCVVLKLNILYILMVSSNNGLVCTNFYLALYNFIRKLFMYVLENVEGIPFSRLMMILKACQDMHYRNSSLLSSIAEHLANSCAMWSSKQVMCSGNKQVEFSGTLKRDYMVLQT